MLNFNYIDDGKGFDYCKAIEKNEGLGLQNINNRIKSIKGSIVFKRLEKNGILYHITIPI